ncbi:ABC transporter permease [Mycolicibacterium neoaurum]|nr:peptide ABC transporter permease [Mycolicibacterium neoaurum]AXK75459.1 ABC transporter permease [Mycolicibacterium neoaurum]
MSVLDAPSRLWVGRSRPWPSAVIVAVVLVAATTPSALTSRDPSAVSPSLRLQAPGLAHPFGTDNLGRDVYTRVVHATAASMTSAGIAVVVALFVGVLLGVATGYCGRWVDQAGMRLVDMLLAVPSLLLSLTVIAATGGGVVEVGVAVGIAGIAGVARVIRARTLQLRSSPFVEAATISGLPALLVVTRHLVPHLWPTAAAVAAVEFGQAVLAVAALGFLGFGPPPPAPEWGAMIADGRGYLADSWWLTLIPAAVVTVVVIAAYRISHQFGTGGDDVG